MHPMIDSLLRPEAYPHPVQKLVLLETHISWVILTGEWAYKLKKPVDFGFVNFTTLERRERFCHEELRLNRRLAADLYKDVVTVFGTDPSTASFVGSGPPLDFAVRMQQFSQDDLLPQVLQRGQLTAEQFAAFADRIAEFQLQSAVATTDDPYGEPAGVWAPVAANFATLLPAEPQSARIQALQTWSEQEFAHLEPRFRERKAAGRVREGHGDLHLGNLVYRHGEIEAFDCLEFNADLRWIDVISEMAFLVMDLSERGRPDLASRVRNRWLERTGDYSGLRVWRWYFIYRALVRAKVATLRSRQPDQTAEELAAHQREVAKYLQLASETAQPQPAGLVITHGVSGSGKSHVTQQLCDELGAIRVRSDVERKRMFGLDSETREPDCVGELYVSATTERLYREVLPALVRSIVDGGFVAVVDAACLQHWQRDGFQKLATELAIPFVILDLPVAPELARRRIAERNQSGGDPSDADARVLDLQMCSLEPLTDAERRATIVHHDVATTLTQLANRIGRPVSAKLE